MAPLSSKKNNKELNLENTPFLRQMFTENCLTEKLRIAIIGGGGKTSLLHQLGKEFSRYSDKVLVTSLTRTGIYKDYKYTMLDDLHSNEIPDVFEKFNPFILMKKRKSKIKFIGLDEKEMFEISEHFDYTIFECDGSRNLPLKKHNQKDQCVPAYSTHAVILVGAEVVDTSINDGLVHRPDLFMQNWGVDKDRLLSSEFIAEVITSTKGYLEVIPDDIPLVYFINKADKYGEKAILLASEVKRKTDYPVFYGSIELGDILEVK